ncbi:membrane protein, BrkB family [Erythrobacter litoralis]|jgi:membrane protein|uniref:Ribonuclease BN n=1 Tax=Erythrobacter litoralis TaxID=39960 RepID=A0A074MB95_9SPHN|nr:YihY/virulence factor BrkB family protein [Erythrobacter litoralis]AOL22054.1 membrane protein, BrkB family [Erythrobacter litoralis]KEO90689.1 ribonuclease BN [Erythrobacter litoralis]MEE4338086.1 YihY/virulence factor BrkB family protein [Erythrobacter sp.]
MAERASPLRSSKLPPAQDREVRSLSPEARRQSARDERDESRAGLRSVLVRRMGPGTRAFEVFKRTMVGTYQDGFIHAGNLAYLSMLAIFPFFIIGAAVFQLVGGAERTSQMIAAVLVTLPPTVSDTIEPVAANIVEARSGWLLWLGAAVALWTVSSLVETIRDILRRAYGTKAIHAFWKYRLLSAGIILAAVVLLLISLFAQVVIGTAQAVIDASLPQLSQLIGTLRLSRIVPALGLALSLYMLFYSLTPHEYRSKAYPKWPGALFTAAWWLGVTTALPPILSSFFAYNLTYGSLAGIIIALFFFWLVGLGLVIGAELNAALAEPETAGDELANDSADNTQTEE